ncbi:MAG: ribosome maturation factor RimP [Acidimicrobiales bacterium]
MVSADAVRQRVHELVEPLTSDLGLELVDVETGPGMVKVTLDRDGGIDLEAITEASERVSRLLDVHDPVPGSYTLEVTSPGLERPLRTPAQFRRFVGSVVAVKTHPHVEGERRLRGVIEVADDGGVVIEGRRLAYTEIERARTVFEWAPAPKPGSRPKGARS